jgi:uncharacterized protein with GYD domain
VRTALLGAAALLAAMIVGAGAQSPAPAAPPVTAGPPGTMLMTVFLKHDQSKTLDEINDGLKRNGYYDKFPPQGVEIDSWYVVMGIGQIVTLRFAPERLREINRVLEQSAWGGYRTEFFPAYDYKAAAEQQRRQMQAK